MKNLSKFLFKSVAKAVRSDVLKTRRNLLKGLDQTQFTKHFRATLDSASAAWMDAQTSASRHTSEERKESGESGSDAGPPNSEHGREQNFSEQQFKFKSNVYRYRVFVPTRSDESALPMVVMLHGCKQDALDFSKGVEMNSLAEREKFIVLYPEQLRKSNQSNCWNWFDPAHQSRGSGEPEMIASLTSFVANQLKVDTRRIYIAGLSAGGAMAALVGKLYPEIYTAVGVHSGLPPHSARDVITAFNVMAKGPGSREQTEAIGLPTIVFQGTADNTVSPANAESIVKAELQRLTALNIELTEHSHAIDRGLHQRSAAVRSWARGNGPSLLEMWLIKDTGHAWSGGSNAGSYTDTAGPFATIELFRFFKAHRNNRN